MTTLWTRWLTATVLLSFLSCLFVSALVGQSLRLNEQPRTVARPASSNHYATALHGSDLYAAWAGPTTKGMQIYLARVALPGFERQEEVRQLTEGYASGKGLRISPQLTSHDQALEIVWMERTFQDQRSHYFLKLLSLSEVGAGQDDPQVLDYGRYLNLPSYVSTTKGLFLIGYSIPIEGENWILRIYRKEKQAWAPIELPTQTGMEGREPVLLEDKEGLSLFWILQGRLLRSRSTEGREWGAPEVLHEARILLLDGAIRPDGRIDLAWIEEDAGKASIWTLGIQDSESSRPEKALQVDGTRMNLVLGANKAAGTVTIAYSYRNKQERSQVIGALVSDAEGWTNRRLSPPGRHVEVSRMPVVSEQAGRVFVVWSFRHDETLEDMAAGIYLNFNDEDGEWREEAVRVDPGDSAYSLSAPRFLEYEGRHLISYYSYRAKGPGFDSRMGRLMANPSKGDLYLREVDLQLPEKEAGAKSEKRQ